MTALALWFAAGTGAIALVSAAKWVLRKVDLRAAARERDFWEGEDR